MAKRVQLFADAGRPPQAGPAAVLAALGRTLADGA